jgi:ABC-type multidrug transport system fused ATPase/permease subunit
MLTPSAITITTFWCYTKLAHQELNIPVAFSALSAFQLIQQPLFELPMKVMFFLRTIVSVKRLDRYLAEPEMEDLLSAPGTPGKNGDSVANGVGNGNGHASQSNKDTQTLAFHNSIHRYPQHEIQDDSVEPFLLKCSDLVFPTGKLTVVYGGNASGKTSLLMACIGGGYIPFVISFTMAAIGKLSP